MPSPFLQELVRDMRLRGCALRTQKTYLHWVHRYIQARYHPSGASHLIGAVRFGATGQKSPGRGIDSIFGQQRVLPGWAIWPVIVARALWQ